DLKPQPVWTRVLRPFVTKQQPVIRRGLFEIRHIQHDVIQAQGADQWRPINDASCRHRGSGKPAWNTEELKLDAVGVANHSNAARTDSDTTRLEFLSERLSVVTINQRAVVIDSRWRALLSVHA